MKVFVALLCLSLPKRESPDTLGGRKFHRSPTNPTNTETMSRFSTSLSDADELIKKAKKVAKGESMEDAGLDHVWLQTYAYISVRVSQDLEHGMRCHPYEVSRQVNPFTGFFFREQEMVHKIGPREAEQHCNTMNFTVVLGMSYDNNKTS